MNILHIYKDYYPVLGGIENHVRVLAEAGARRGHEVTVLVANTARRTSVESVNGVRVIKAGRWLTLASTPISPAMFLQAGRLKADIAHLHFPHPPGEIANWLLHPARRTVISYHSDVVRQAGLLRFYKPLMKHVLERADAIIVGSPPMKNSVYLADHQAKLQIVPYGLPLNRFLTPPTAADLERVAARYPAIAASLPKLLFVGRLRYYKGVNVLLDALPDLQAQLLIAGIGPMLNEWQAYARLRGVADRVAWLGEVSDADLPVLYRLAQLFVLPATHPSEAFGLVQVEAMASGIPTVCTELGTGTSWVTLDGQTGYVVPPHDPRSLAAVINQVLNDDQLRAQLGRAAQARAQAEFTVERMIERVYDDYDRLLS